MPAVSLIAAAPLAAAPLAAAAGVAPTGARGFERTETREPCADHDPLRGPYFGDLHVHTSFSQDASTQGTRNTPWDAYRFAQGERLGIQPYDAQGRPRRSLQLRRPLDFAVVTDHAEMLGEVRVCQTPGLAGHDSWVCRIYRRWPRAAFFLMNTKSSMRNPTRFGFCGEGGARCLEAAVTPWTEIQAAAEGAYDRTSSCRFTTFVGYEWTASVDTKNLHRNVVFRNERVPTLPASFYEAPEVELLWDALETGCIDRGDGCDALVIPHNSNLSDGLMFPITDEAGRPLGEGSARRRAELEPVVEIMQHKGDSECDPGGSPEDELCGFEKLSFANFLEKFVPFLAEPPEPSSFTRRALLEGLREEERLGVNPFRFGVIASTDTHLGTPGAVSEDSHVGHGGAGAPAARELPKGLPDDLEFNPGGLAVIWAEENSRDALFEALRRREVYGTSGPRHVVRFFGGWDLPQDQCDAASFAATGYERGVPMGGELPPPPRPGGAPAFAVSALRDPGPPGRPGTLLQRIQIVKGWLEGDEMREVVHDVAGDAGNGASVDLASCRPRGPGADGLCTVWRDPDFDPDERAFYYARVVENPTCRWSTVQCNARGVDCSDPGNVPEELAVCCAPEHRKVVQERSWTSPIWYSPR